MAEKKNPYAGTQTEKNLLAALAGESKATNKYTYFASRAKKDGYEQIAALFLKTASNEREHAKLWFKELFGIGTTAENLLSAAEGENYEWTDSLYLPKTIEIANNSPFIKFWYQDINGKVKMDNVINLLTYKHQIILQGPPGTGKTRLAKLIAEDMIRSKVIGHPE